MFYTLPTTVTVNEKEYNIRSDYRVILDIIEMLNDPDLTNEEKCIATLEMFYPDEVPPDIQQAMEQCFEFMDMGGGSKKKKNPRLVDWEHDFPYIIAPINRVLGFESRSVEYLHWWSFMGAYMEIGGDCLFSQVVSMRDKLGRGKKLEKHEREWLRRNRDIVDLPTKYSDTDADMERYWTGGGVNG